MNKNEHIQARQQARLARWRLREKQKDLLKEAGISYTQSPNAGIVYVETHAGSASYKLVNGSWKVPDGTEGQGAANLKKFLEGV